MLTPEERLEQLEKVFDDLEDFSQNVPIVVEGIRDVEALRRLGIAKNVVALNRGISVFSFSERISKEHRKAVILTDWDRRGGQLARMLKEALMANGVEVIDRIRTQIVILSKKEVKDIESLPTYIDRLRARDASQRMRARIVRGKRI
jgi:5S rRNA maturation endonuclease (ribonuclease M5)